MPFIFLRRISFKFQNFCQNYLSILDKNLKKMGFLERRSNPCLLLSSPLTLDNALIFLVQVSHLSCQGVDMDLYLNSKHHINLVTNWAKFYIRQMYSMLNSKHLRYVRFSKGSSHPFNVWHSQILKSISLRIMLQQLHFFLSILIGIILVSGEDHCNRML